LGIAGRRAFVAGSSSGIGAGIARALGAEGAHVVVHGRKRERAEEVASDIRANGGSASVVLADLDDPAAVAALADELLATGTIDILVNSAGAGSSRSWFDVSIEDWRRQLQHSLSYAVQFIHALVPPMRQRGWGRVLNLSSAAAFKMSGYGPEYAAAKLALQSVAGSLAAELGGCGATVNTLTSGLVLTENTRHSIARLGVELGFAETGEELETRVIRDVWQVQFGRAGTLDELAAAACFLVSDSAGYITGASLRVDGAASRFVH